MALQGLDEMEGTERERYDMDAEHGEIDWKRRNVIYT